MEFVALLLGVVVVIVVNTFKKKLSESMTDEEPLSSWDELIGEDDNIPHEINSGEKPITPHSPSACTGGSIHDGYHEGTAAAVRESAADSLKAESKSLPKLNRKPFEKNLPKKPAPGSTHSILAEDIKPASRNDADPPSGIELLTKKLSNEPQIVQGIIWGEILGKPKSDY